VIESFPTPDPEPTRDSVYDDANRAAVWGLSVNVGLVGIKVLGGILTGSAALLADGVNSIGDVASALAVRVALHIARQDEDEDHPYGHTKAESIAGLSVAVAIVLSAAFLALENSILLTRPLSIVTPFAGFVALISSIIKEVMFHYVNRVANRLRSASLLASALDHRSDAIGSFVVAIALLCSPLFGDYSIYVDPIAAIAVCLYLIVVGSKALVTVSRELMDQQADPALIARVRSIAGAVPCVANVEKVRVRKSGLEYFAEVHVQVEGHLTVNEGHRIGHRVKDELMSAIPRLRDVHIHIEPDEPSRDD